MTNEPKILLVDDERLVRRSMQKTLMRAGLNAETAADCPEGLETFLEARQSGEPYDLVVVDLNMPGFEGQPQEGAGLQLISRLVEKQPDLPVIVLTAYDEVFKAKQAVQRGARDFFVKGREEGLAALIKEIIE